MEELFGFGLILYLAANSVCKPNEDLYKYLLLYFYFDY